MTEPPIQGWAPKKPPPQGNGDSAPKPITSQFELNRFTRQWHADHPTGTRDELMAAWWAYRSLPTDARAMA